MTNDMLTIAIQDGIQCNSRAWHIGGDEVMLTVWRGKLQILTRPVIVHILLREKVWC